ncbi:MAG: hypothetical protein K2Q26_13840 [Bdellovibrionales bacterium]|nr:hypothetical protein [Bdellovibrionales bacterium]
MSSLAQFITGLLSPIKGMLLVFSRLKWFILAVIPFWIFVGLMIYSIVHFFQSGATLMQLAFNYLPWLVSFSDQIKMGDISLFTAIFQGVFWFFVFMFFSYFSYLVLSVTGAPFYVLLSGSILVSKGVRTQDTTGVWHWFATTCRMLILGLAKMSIFVLISAVLFFLAMIPVFTIFVPFFFCMMIAFDCTDFSFENMGYTLRQRWQFFWSRSPLFLGMSLPILIAGSVPGLFVFTLPFFIAGAADAFALTHEQVGINE